MTPVYVKLGIVAGGIAASIFGVKKLLAPKLSTPAAAPTVSSVTKTVTNAFADPQSALLPNGQTQAEVDAITEQNSAEVADLLSGLFSDSGST